MPDTTTEWARWNSWALNARFFKQLVNEINWNGCVATYYCVRHILKDLLWNTCIMENEHKIFSQKICVLMCIFDMRGTRFDMNEEFGIYTVGFFLLLLSLTHNKMVMLTIWQVFKCWTECIYLSWFHVFAAYMQFIGCNSS